VHLAVGTQVGYEIRTETEAAVECDTATFTENFVKICQLLQSKKRHSMVILRPNFGQGK
jgi:hypothetical protein